MGRKRKNVKLFSTDDYLAVLEPKQDNRPTEFVTPSGQIDFGSTMRGYAQPEPSAQPPTAIQRPSGDITQSIADQISRDNVDVDLAGNNINAESNNNLRAIPMLASQFAGGLMGVEDYYTKKIPVIGNAISRNITAPIKQTIDESTESWSRDITPGAAAVVRAIGQSPAAGLNMTADGIAGLARFTGDVMSGGGTQDDADPNDPETMHRMAMQNTGRDLVKWGQSETETSKRVDAEMDKDVPGSAADGWARSMRSGLGSAYNNLLMMPLYLVNPELPLIAMGAQSGGSGYSEARDKGNGVLSSALQGTGKGAMEVATEKIPFGQLMKLVKPEANMTFRSMLSTLGKFEFGEYVGESINTIYSDIQDKLFETPDASFDRRIEKVNEYFLSGEAERNLKETLRTTLIQSTAMGGGAALLNRRQIKSGGVEIPPITPAPTANTPDVDLTAPGGVNTNIPAPVVPPTAPPTDGVGGIPERRRMAQSVWEQRQQRYQTVIPNQSVAPTTGMDMLPTDSGAPANQVAAPPTEPWTPPPVKTVEDYQKVYAEAHDAIIALNDAITSTDNPDELKRIKAQLTLAKMRETAAKDNITRLETLQPPAGPAVVTPELVVPPTDTVPTETAPTANIVPATEPAPVNTEPVTSDVPGAPVEAAAETTTAPTSYDTLLRNAMEKGVPMNKVQLINHLAQQEGVKPAEITRRVDAQELDWKGVEEGVESAAVGIARSIMAENKPWTDKVADLERLYTSHPNLAHRTSDSKALQQYSTPLPIAGIMAEHVNMAAAKSVYEPTAGNGALLIGANPAAVTANELDSRRHDSLKSQGFKTVLNEDAMGDIQKVRDKSQDVVVMNPPFGVADNSLVVDGAELTKREHIIAAQALDKMKDGGQAAIIIGGHNFEKGKMTGADQVFFNWLYNHYNVSHNIDIDGKLYSRQGTSYPVRLITVEGRKATVSDDFVPNQRADARAAELGIGVENAKTFDEIRGILKVERGTDNETGTERTDTTDTGNRTPVRGERSDTTADAARPADNDGIPGRSGDSGGRGGHTEQPAVDDRNRGDGNNQSGTVPGTTPGRGVESGAAGHNQDNGRGAGVGGRGGRERGGVRQLMPEFEGLEPEVLQGIIDAGVDPYAQEETEPATQGEKADSTPANLSSMDTAAQNIADILADADFSLRSDDQKKGAWDKILPHAQQVLDDIIAKANLLTADAGNLIKQFVSDLTTKVKTALESKGLSATDIAKRIGAFVQQLNRFAQDARANIEQMISKAKDQDKPAKNTHELQAPYPQRSKGWSSGKLAPINLAPLMDKALTALEEKVGDLDAYVQNKLGYETHQQMFDALSGEQIDAVALAIDAIDNNSGVIIGDQTGVGKGRIASAIMLYAKRLGKKPIFVTEKPKLFSDINRDIVDVTNSHPGDVLKPFIVGDGTDSNITDDTTGDVVYEYRNGMTKPGRVLKNGKDGRRLQMSQSERYQEVIDNPADALKDFDYVAITYDQLKGDLGLQRREMIRQLAQGNIVIMDEAHNAAGESGVGEYFKGQILPIVKAGTYLSATYAKRPSAMSLYSITELGRTGMKQSELESAIVAGGVPMQQIISGLLAESGQYIRRENDYTQMEQPVIDIDTSEQATRDLESKADASTDILRDILDFSNAFGEWIKTDVARSINGNITRKQDRYGVSSTGFASTVHNYVRQLTLALKVDQMVDNGIRALANGEKPLFYIDNTMNAFLTDYMTENGLKRGDVMDANFGEVMRRGLKKQLSYNVTAPGKKNGEKRFVSPDELSGTLRYLYDRINDKIDAYDVDVPVSPIDAVAARLTQRAKTELGMDVNTIEITGRDYIVDMTDEDQPVIDKRSTTNRNDIVNGFNGNGDGPRFDVLTFNQAGATGLSLHPTEKTGDKRPRHMFIVQPSLNVDSYMQALGRIFRTGQVHKPKYTNLVLNLPTETRPAIVQNRKLAAINANLAAKTEGVFTFGDIPDMDNHYGDEVIDNYLRENGDIATLVNMSAAKDGDDSTGKFATFSGRLALLPVEQQKAVWADLVSDYKVFIDYLNEMGENNLVAKDYDLQARTVKSHTIMEQSGDGIFQSSSKLEEVDAKILKRQFTKAKVESLVNEELKGRSHDEYTKAIRDGITSAVTAARNILDEQLQEAVKNRTDDEDNTAAIEKKIATLGSMGDAMTRNVNRIQIGSAYDLKLAHGNVTGVVVGVKYAPGTAGSPVAPSKLSFKFAINDAIQTVSIPLSRLTKIEPDHIGRGVPSEWDNSMTNRTTERRFIATGNLLRGMGKVKGHGQVVYYTDDKGVRNPGVLLNGSKETRLFIDSLINRVGVTLNTLLEAIKGGRFGEADTIRPSALNINSIRFAPHNNTWVMWVEPRAAEVMGDNIILDNAVVRRFDRGTGNQASMMYARFDNNKIGKVVSRLAEMSPGITFEVPKGVLTQDAQAQFSQTDTPVTTGVSESVIQDAVNKINTEFPDIPVVVKDRVNDLPFSAPSDARGAYRNGTVYLVRENIEDNQQAVMTVLAHEITHSGISRLGKRGLQLLNQIAIVHNQDVQEIMKNRGWEDTPDNRVRAANELVAQHGETRLRPNLWQKVKDLLRDAASKITGQPIKTALLDQAVTEARTSMELTLDNGDTEAKIKQEEERHDKIRNGRYVPERLPRQIEELSAESGGINLKDAESLCRGIHSAIDAEEYSRPEADWFERRETYKNLTRFARKGEEMALREWAERNNLMIDPAEFDQQWAAQDYIGGGEHDVWFDKTNQVVHKRNTLAFHPSYLDYFQRLMAYNYFYPQLAYTFKGFMDVDGKLMPVTEQPLIAGRNSTPDESHRNMLDNGMLPADKDNSIYRIPGTHGLLISDVHGANTKIDDNGIGHPIDIIIQWDLMTREKRLAKEIGAEAPKTSHKMPSMAERMGVEQADMDNAIDDALDAWSDSPDFSLLSDDKKSTLKKIFDAGRDLVANLAWDAPSHLGDLFMIERLRAKGRIEISGQAAHRLHDQLAAFRSDENTTRQIFDFLVTRDADVNTITNPAARDVAIEAKDAIITMGRKLVDAGKMSQETLDKHEGEYLPRLYIKHLLGEDMMGRLLVNNGSGGKKMDLSYLKRRDENIPEEVRQLILGEIKDPAYLVFMALARPARDMALNRWFQEIARHTDWALPKMLVDWNIIKNAPRRLGAEVEYANNGDGTYNVTTRKYKRVYTDYTVNSYDEMVALFNAGSEQAAKALAGFVFAKADNSIQKVGQVTFSKNDDGSFNIRIGGKEIHERQHASVSDSDLEMVVGSKRADSIRQGKGHSVGGKTVTPFWLMKEASRIRTMANQGYLDDKQGSLAIAERMDQQASAALDAAGIELDDHGNVKAASIPKGWKQVPPNRIYGDLSGMIVRREVYNDIVGNISTSNGDAADAGKWLLGDNGLLWAAHSAWKMSKTSLNAPSHITNAVSNIFLLHLSGVPIHRIIPVLAKAVQSLLAYAKDPSDPAGKYARIGKDYGVTAATFNSQELMRVNTELLDVLRNAGDKKHPIKQIQFILGKIVNTAGDVYQMWEVIAKTAKLIDCMENEKMPAARAALEAHIALFDYSDVSTTMKFIRQSPLGAPFATFIVKSTGMMVRKAKQDVQNIIKALKPGESFKELGRNRLLAGWASIAFSRKLIGYKLVFKAAAMFMASLADWDEDDYNKFMAVLPQYMREKNHVFIMPWKDEKGNLQYVDISRFLPWDPALSTAKHLAKGDIAKALGDDLGLAGGPIPQLLAVWKTGRDPLTGREIVSKRSMPTVAERASQYLLYGWNMAAPSMFAMANDNTTEYAGARGAMSKIGAAITGHLNPRTGAPVASLPEAGLSLLGVNAKTINVPYQREQNIKRMAHEAKGVMIEAKAALKNRNYATASDVERAKINKAIIEPARKKAEAINAEIEKYIRQSEYRDSALYK